MTSLDRESRLTCVRACVSFQIEGIVESLSTESAEISFELTMILQMSIEKTLQFESLRTKATDQLRAELNRTRQRDTRTVLNLQCFRCAIEERILDSMSPIDQFQRHRHALLSILHGVQWQDRLRSSLRKIRGQILDGEGNFRVRQS